MERGNTRSHSVGEVSFWKGLWNYCKTDRQTDRQTDRRMNE
jgi:hypothetical protein